MTAPIARTPKVSTAPFTSAVSLPAPESPSQKSRTSSTCSDGPATIETSVTICRARQNQNVGFVPTRSAAMPNRILPAMVPVPRMVKASDARSSVTPWSLTYETR